MENRCKAIRRAIRLLWAVLCLVAPSRADAGERSRGVEIYGGWMVVGTTGVGTQPDESHTIEATTKDGGVAGFRISNRLFRGIEIEFDFAGTWAQHEVVLYSSAYGPPEEPPVDVSVELSDAMFRMSVGPVFYLIPQGGIRPYLTGGVGGVAFVDNRTLAYHYAGGVEISLSRRIAVRLDWRRTHTTLRGDLAEVLDILPGGELAGMSFPFEDKVTLTNGTAGLRIRY